MEETQQHLEALNNNARDVRTYTLGFVAFLAYFAVIIGSTTDLQLVRVEPVALPLLNVSLPIVGFYLVVPFLLVLLHGHLLLQLQEMASKQHLLQNELRRLPEAEQQHFYRQLIGFPPLQWLRPRDHHTPILRRFYHVFVWVSVVVLPLLLLLWAQLRFVPYHDWYITWLHRIAVLIDVSMLLAFWPMILGHGLKYRVLHDLREWVIALIIIFSLGLIFFLGEVANLITGSYRRRKAKWPITRQHKIEPKRKNRGLKLTPLPAPRRGMELVYVGTIGGLVFSLIVIQTPIHLEWEKKERNNEWCPLAGFPKKLFKEGNWANCRLVQRPNKLERDKNRGFLLPSRSHWLLGDPEGTFYHSLRLREALLAKGTLKPEVEAALRSGDPKRIATARNGFVGIGISRPDAPRDLSYADLRSAILVNADLRDARLDGANLVEAHLEGAKLYGANLERAMLTGAYLEDTKLVGPPNREGVKRRKTQLSGADLSETSAQGANLSNDAQLKDANLRGAQWEGANLVLAKMSNADATFAHFEGANFKAAHLNGATLAEANLEGANLTGARLQGADLRFARLEGADLSLAKLQGADLRDANLDGAKISDSEWDYAIIQDLSRGTLTEAKVSEILNRKLKERSSDEIPKFMKELESRLGNRVCTAPEFNMTASAREIRTGGTTVFIDDQEHFPANDMEPFLAAYSNYRSDLVCNNAELASQFYKRAETYGAFLPDWFLVAEVEQVLERVQNNDKCQFAELLDSKELADLPDLLRLRLKEENENKKVVSP